VSQVVYDKKIPLVDVGTVALIRQGKIAVVPGIEAFTPEAVRFVDGRAMPFDAVVLATGYRTGLAGFLDDAPRYLDAEGYPRDDAAEAAPRRGCSSSGIATR
jgi:indole-3-pyruvate monooxygenase